MERRALVAIALSIAVLLIFRYVEEWRTGDRARVRPPVHKSTPPAPPFVPAAGASAAPPQPEAQPAAQAVSRDTVASAHPIVVDGDLYRAVLDNRGGLLTSWVLKKYKSGKGEVFEIIAVRSPESRPYPG